MSSLVSNNNYKYVILGGGVAAGYAAREFVNQGITDNDVLIVSRDKVAPYERPALSKGFLSPEDPARLPGFHTCVGEGGDRQDASWYNKNGIQWQGKTNVVDIDFQDRSLKTENGGSIGYEKLVIATGAEPIRLDLQDKPGEIHYLRSLMDAEDLVENFPSGGHAIMLGGGYIGTEVGAGLIKNGFKVTFVYPDDQLMQRVFTPKMAQVYADTFTEHGAQFVQGIGKMVVRDDNGKIIGLGLRDGNMVDGDVIVAGVGARTNLDLFKEKLETEAGGLKVNGQLRTSDPNVYAVGDIAAFPLKLEGGKIQRQEHVANARRTAEHAVRAMVSEVRGDGDARDDYDYTPYFYSRIFDFNWKLFGVNEGDPVHFGEFKQGEKFGALWIRDGKVVGALLERGTDEEFDQLKSLIRDRPDVKGKDGVSGVIHDIFGKSIKVEE